MAEKIDELYVEIKAKTDKLEAELNSLTNKMNKKGVTLKAKFDSAVAKMKISELEKLHAKLKAEWNKKISMNVDAASLDRTRIKLASVENTLRGVRNEVPKTTSKFESMFTKLAAAGAVYMGVRKAFQMVGDAISAAFEARKSIAQIETAVMKTGHAAGFSSKAIQGMASDLQDLTGIGDDQSLKEIYGQLLTFTNIRGDIFKRAGTAVADLSAVIGSDLTSQSIQLGKALERPVEGMAALQRVGIIFTADQKKQIENFMKQGDLLSAQNIILSEIETKYGGQAKSQADALMGIKQINEAVGDYKEAWGDAFISILEGFAKLIGYSKGFTDFLKDQGRRVREFFGIKESTVEKQQSIMESFIGYTPEMLAEERKIYEKELEKAQKGFEARKAQFQLSGGELATKLGGEGIKKIRDRMKQAEAAIDDYTVRLKALDEYQRRVEKGIAIKPPEIGVVTSFGEGEGEKEAEYTSGLMGQLKKQMDELQKLDPTNEQGWANLKGKIQEVQKEMDRLNELTPDYFNPKIELSDEDVAPFDYEGMTSDQTGRIKQNQEDRTERAKEMEQAQEDLPRLYEELRNQLVGGLGEVSSIVTDLLGGAESSAGRIVNGFNRAVSTVNQIYNLFQSIKATIEAIETAKSIIDIGKTALGLAGGGSFIVPAGYSRDNFPLMPGISAQSGELITVTPKGQVSSQLKMNTQLLNAVNGLARNMAINGRPIININTEADWLKVTQQKITPAQTLNSRTRSSELSKL